MRNEQPTRAQRLAIAVGGQQQRTVSAVGTRPLSEQRPLRRCGSLYYRHR